MTLEASPEVSLSRADILGTMDRISKERRGKTARQIFRDYSAGRLESPGEVIEVIALARLLDDDDPFFYDGH